MRISDWSSDVCSSDLLAAKIGVDPDGLEATVARFNGFAATGKDLDFKRGDKAYDLVYADRTHKPSPTLGPIETPPFYSIEVFPGDVGTFGGILTDEYARALREDGSVIPGLYATGNSTDRKSTRLNSSH